MELLLKQRKPGNDDNIIPMINVVFLLLIFFMIAGQIKPPANPDITLPEATLGTAIEQPSERLEIDANNRLFLNGQPITLHALKTTVQRHPTSGIPGTEKQPVAVIADKNLLAVELDAVLEVFRERGDISITLFTRASDTSPSIKTSMPDSREFSQ